MSDERRIVRVRRRTDEDDDPDVRAMTPAERIEMMWQLALDAWASWESRSAIRAFRGILFA